MKLSFLDSLIKRIAFSFGLSAIGLVLGYFIAGPSFIDIQWIPLAAVIVYISVTLFYAIMSTFFKQVPHSEENDEILDR